MGRYLANYNGVSFGEKVNAKESANLFRRALEILEERGWTQGKVKDDDGRVCYVGAIQEALDELNSSASISFTHPAVLIGQIESVEKDGGFFFKDPSGAIKAEDWNDLPSTTYEDVVLAMKKQIEIFESENDE